MNNGKLAFIYVIWPIFSEYYYLSHSIIHGRVQNLSMVTTKIQKYSI